MVPNISVDLFLCGQTHKKFFSKSVLMWRIMQASVFFKEIAVCLHYENVLFVDDAELPGIKINIKELDDVLLRDVGNKIADSGK